MYLRSDHFPKLGLVWNSHQVGHMYGGEAYCQASKQLYKVKGEKN